MITFILSCSVTPSLVVTEKNGTKEFKIKSGEVVEIRLLGQLGTGFSWKVKIDEEFLKEVDTMVLTGEKQETSGWDTQIFQYRALKPGKVPLTFQYIRPWKKEEKPKKEFNCIISIE